MDWQAFALAKLGAQIPSLWTLYAANARSLPPLPAGVAARAVPRRSSVVCAAASEDVGTAGTAAIALGLLVSTQRPQVVQLPLLQLPLLAPMAI